MSESIVTARDIEIVTAEINTIKAQAQRVLLVSAIEIGRRLVEAKSMVNHGEWGKWLEERVSYSQSTANNLMKIYNEYGGDQTSLFDNMANSQTFGNLSYSQALALLAVPAEERADFVADNDVEHKSTRELQELIRQRDEESHLRRAAEVAKEEAEAAAADLQDQLKAAGATICDLTAQASKNVESLRQEAVAAQKAEEAANHEVGRLEDKLRKAQQERENIQAQLEEARRNPSVTADMMEQLRTEAEAAAAEKAAAMVEKELDKARKAQKQAQERAEAAEQEIVEIKDQLAAVQSSSAMQNPNVAAFQELFMGVQKDFERMTEIWEKLAQYDRPKADSLRRAMMDLLDSFRKQIGGSECLG